MIAQKRRRRRRSRNEITVLMIVMVMVLVMMVDDSLRPIDGGRGRFILSKYCHLYYYDGDGVGGGDDDYDDDDDDNDCVGYYYPLIHYLEDITDLHQLGSSHDIRGEETAITCLDHPLLTWVP